MAETTPQNPKTTSGTSSPDKQSSATAQQNPKTTLGTSSPDKQSSATAQQNPKTTSGTSSPEKQSSATAQPNPTASEPASKKQNLIQWLRGSALVAQAMKAEERAQELFEECVDKNVVELKKFQQVVSTLTREQDKNVEELTRILAEQGPPVAAALDATDKGLKEAIQE